MRHALQKAAQGFLCAAFVFSAQVAAAQMIDYRSLVGDRRLQDLQALEGAEPFSETLWILNETEHGTDAPGRLFAFDDLLSHPARSPEADASLIVPFLVRYLWEVPYPTYTAAAWRTLSRVVEDTADLADLAHDILSGHPHGALRAEILRWDEEYSTDYLSDDSRFAGLIARLLVDDPAPAVRAAAARHLLLSGEGALDPAILLDRLRTDSAAEVREVLLDEILSRPASAFPAPEAAIIAALRDPANAPVLPRLLWRFGQGRVAGLETDPDHVAVLMDLIAAGADHPRAADLRRSLNWLILGMGDRPDGAAALWLSGTPYGDGAALTARAMALFADAGAGVADRAHALALLNRLDLAPDPAALVAFLLAPDQTAGALDAAADARRGLQAMLGARPPADAAALVGQLMAHLQTRPDRAGDDPPGDAFAEALLSRALRLAVQDSAGQPLLDVALAAVRDAPRDLSPALYEVDAAASDLDLSGLADIALAATDPYARRFAAAIAARRYDAFRDEADLALLERILSTTREVEVAGDAVRVLPPRADLGDGSDHGDRLAAVLAWVAAADPAGDIVVTMAQDAVIAWLE